MQKIAIGIGLTGLLLLAANTSAQAVPVVPLAQTVIVSPSDLTEVQWRGCWRDRWGRLRCPRCWRNRWGRLICR